MKSKWVILGLLLLGAQPSQGQQPVLTFFITSAGSGNGANLGGLAGADKICQTLADAVPGAHVPRLQSGEPGGNRRERLLLLFRDRELN